MNVTIIETNEETILSIIDPKSGMDWTNDLLGNHGELPDYNDETDSYHMDQESFDWWSDLIERYEAADNRLHELKQSLSWEETEEIEAILESVLSCDLEDKPEAMQQVCDEWEAR